MAQITQNVLVPYTPAQMFALVQDIEKYQQFLPWCAASTVDSHEEQGVCATLSLAYRSLKQSFTTRNAWVDDESISMSLVRGPFHRLEGAWGFVPEGAGCRVSLDLHYDIRNPVLRLTLGPVFHKICSKLIAAFTERAEVVYGR